LLGQGHPASRIKELLGITYNTIRRYKDGDPDLLCRFPERHGAYSVIDGHREFIAECLGNKMTAAAILREINKTDPSIKKTAFNEYCARLKAERGINNKTNTAGKELNLGGINVRYVKRKDIMQYLWTGEGLEEKDFTAAAKEHEAVRYLEDFVYDFKSVFAKKEQVMLRGFVEIYEDSPYKTIKSFINGLLMDIEAVENAVALPFSNGFVEGCNNRLKMVKRTMYGRAKMPLLRVKILFGDYIFLNLDTQI